MPLSSHFKSLAAAILAIAAGAPAPAAEGPIMSRIQVEPGALAHVRAPGSFARVAGDNDINRVFAGTGSSSVSRVHAAGDGMAAAFWRARGESEVADAFVAAEAISNSLSRPLSFGGIHADRALSIAQLDEQLSFFNRMIEGRVEYTRWATLAPDRIKEFALPGGWVFRYVGPMTFDLIDPVTGQGVRTIGDPHQAKITRDGAEKSWYRDWQSNCQIYKLPSRQGQSTPTLVIAFSDGNGQANAYGEVTHLYVLGERQWFYIHGLKDGDLTGCGGEGAKYLALGPVLRPELARAERQSWDPATGLMAPNPEDAYDPVQIFQDVHFIGAGSVDKLDKGYREAEASLGQALSLRGAPLPDAAADDLAESRIQSIQADARIGRDNVQERRQLSYRVDAMRQRLNEIRDIISTPGMGAREIRAREAEARELIASMKAILEEAKTLGAPGGHS